MNTYIDKVKCLIAPFPIVIKLCHNISEQISYILAKEIKVISFQNELPIHG